MSVPFSSDEFLLKRSLFSSIFGVANRLRQANRTTATEAPPGPSVCDQFAESEQPCSSSRLADPEYTTLVPVPLAFPHSPAYSPTSQLGHQLADSLAFGDNGAAATEGQPAITKEQIYAEIVRECEQLEQRGPNPDGEMGRQRQKQQQRTAEVISAALPCPNPPTIEDVSDGNLEELGRKVVDEVHQQQHNIHQLRSSLGHVMGGGFSVDLEKLVKVVATYVMRELKGAGGMETAKTKRSMTMREAEKQQAEVPRIRMDDEKEDNDDGDGEDESAEQILERKREQNNAAASRYRKRQREQRVVLQEELAELERRNAELKEEVELVGKELELVKSELWSRWRR